MNLCGGRGSREGGGGGGGGTSCIVRWWGEIEGRAPRLRPLLLQKPLSLPPSILSSILLWISWSHILSIVFRFDPATMHTATRKRKKHLRCQFYLKSEKSFMKPCFLIAPSSSSSSFDATSSSSSSSCYRKILRRGRLMEGRSAAFDGRSDGWTDCLQGRIAGAEEHGGKGIRQ